MALENILILSFLLVMIQLTIPMLIELFTKNSLIDYCQKNQYICDNAGFGAKLL